MSINEKMTAIADVIRAKTGNTETLTLDQMAQEIAGIHNYSAELLAGTVTEINDENCPGLKHMRNYAYANDKTIKGVVSSTLESLGTMTFNRATGLAYFHAENLNTIEVAAKSFQYCSTVERIVLGFVNRLPSSFAEDCKKLKYVDVKGVDSVDIYAFWACSALEALIIRCDKVPTLQANVFNESSIAAGAGFIYVPRDQVESYKSATNWSAVANQIRAIEDHPDIAGVGA